MFKKLIFWKDYDEGKKRFISAILALLFCIIAIFLFISISSYLFTWEMDQSLLNDNMSEMASKDTAGNLAGSFGNSIAYILVARYFGLASYAIVCFFLFIAIHFYSKKQDIARTFKRLLLSFSAAILFSLIFAYIAHFSTYLSNVFAGGLGGLFSASLMAMVYNLLGPIVSCVILLTFLLIWLFFVSERFVDGFLNLHTFSKKKVSEDYEDVQEDDQYAEKTNDENTSDIRAELPASTHESQTVAKSSQTNQISQTTQDSASDSIHEEYNPTHEEEENPCQTKNASQNASQDTARDASGEEANLQPSYNKRSESVFPERATTQSELSGDLISVEDLSNKSLEQQINSAQAANVVLPDLDIRSELPDYELPGLDLLTDYENNTVQVSEQEINANKQKIQETLRNYKIEIVDIKAVVGSTITLYKVKPAPGVRISAIKNLQEDIAMALNARGVRVNTLSDSVGIEVANEHSSIVSLKAILSDKAFKESKAELPVAIGFTITQDVKVFDLTDLPHLLVAGATKQGKSVGLNVMISSLLYSKHPSELKFVFIDPKKVEFTAYARLYKHYLAVLPKAASEEEEMKNSVVKEAQPADEVLKSLCIEMDARYDLLSKATVSNIKSYNEKYKKRHLLPTDGHKFLPYIVAVIDEYADLTMTTGVSPEVRTLSRSINASIIRLAQKGRAAGIHVVLATQRPSVDVVTGVIKANFPARIAFRVLSAIDSKTILDTTGADKLIGKGDMMYFDGVNMDRVQCAYVSGDEINRITRFVESQNTYGKVFNTPYYLPEPEPEAGSESTGALDAKKLDERFFEAAELVFNAQRTSTTDLQRNLGMGFPKASRVMDQLQAAGIVGPSDGSKTRPVLIQDPDEFRELINSLK